MSTMKRLVCVIAECRGGDFRRVSFEVASEGRRLADALGAELCGIVVGSGIREKASELAKYGVDRVVVTDDPALEHYLTETHAHVIGEILRDLSPRVVLFPATVDGKDLAARLAARLQAGLVQDCVQIDCHDGGLRARWPVFSGKAYAWSEWSEGSAIFISCRPNVMDCLPADGSRSAPVEEAAVAVPEARTRVVGMDLDTSGKTDLSEADIIVSGGRGLKDASNYAMLEDLADVLGAAIGASRAAVDAGWRPYSDQVGQTGKVVTPDLYIAVGISGAIQHLAGMGSSKYIVAINKDPDAPIFSKADYGIVEDLFEFVPAFTEAVKKLKGTC